MVPNHFHLLVRAAQTLLSRGMRSLTSGHAGPFNRRHRRHGHLFQDRFKSIVCEEKPYVLKMIRYIHFSFGCSGAQRGCLQIEGAQGSSDVEGP